MIIRALTMMMILLSVTAVNLKAGKLESLIEANEKARGISNYEKVKNYKIVSKTSQMGMELKQIIFFKKPDMTRIETEAMGNKTILTYDGKEAWVKQGEQYQQLPEEQLGNIKMQKAFVEGFLANANEQGLKLTLKGKETIDGIEAYKIHIESKDGEDGDVYLNSKTNLIHKVVMNNPDQGGQVTIKMLDYKTVKGIVLPFKMEISVMGQIITTVYESFEIDIKMDDKIFKKS